MKVFSEGMTIMKGIVAACVISLQGIEASLVSFAVTGSNEGADISEKFASFAVSGEGVYE